MPKKVWSDYTLIETFYKRVSQHGVVADVQYSRFACPYNCNKFVELPTASVSNNKSTECRHHLLSCCGVASDGRKAVDDTRIADARTPVVGTAVSSGQSRRADESTKGAYESTKGTTRGANAGAYWAIGS